MAPLPPPFTSPMVTVVISGCSLSLSLSLHFSLLYLHSNSLSLYYSHLNIICSHLISHRSFFFCILILLVEEIVKLHLYAFFFFCDVDIFKFSFYQILCNLSFLINKYSMKNSYNHHGVVKGILEKIIQTLKVDMDLFVFLQEKFLRPPLSCQMLQLRRLF